MVIPPLRMCQLGRSDVTAQCVTHRLLQEHHLFRPPSLLERILWSRGGAYLSKYIFAITWDSQRGTSKIFRRLFPDPVAPGLVSNFESLPTNDREKSLIIPRQRSTHNASSKRKLLLTSSIYRRCLSSCSAFVCRTIASTSYEQLFDLARYRVRPTSGHRITRHCRPVRV